MRFLPKSGGKTDFDLIALCTLAFLYGLLLFSHGIDMYGLVDWDATFMTVEVFRRSIVLFGEPPLWNPYSCGGLPLIFHPQYLVSPLWIGPSLLLGTIAGVKVSIVVHFVIGAAGMVFLSRKLEFSRAGVWAATSIFVFSPFHSWHIFAGFGIFTGIFLFPWLVYFLLDAGKSYKSAYMAGIVMLLLITGLAATMLVPALMFVGIWFGFESVRRRTRAPILGVIAAVAMGTLFSLFKVLYSWELFERQGGRLSGLLFPGLTLDLLGYALFIPEKIMLVSSQLTGLPEGFDDLTYIWEFTMYIGLPAGFAVILGLIIGFKKYWPLLISMFICLWAAGGYNSEVSLFALLVKLPVFDSLRYATRFRFGFFFGLALLAGIGITKISQRVDKRWAGLLVVIILADLWMAGAPLMYRTFQIPMEIIKLNYTPGPFRQVSELPFYRHPLENADWLPYNAIFRKEYFHVLANIGISKCYDPTRWPRSARGEGEDGYLGEVFTDSPSKITGIDWTPSSAVVKVERENGGMLILNQNWDPGWNAEVNGKKAGVEKMFGLVAVKTPAGQSDVRFYYFPRQWLSTLALSFVSIVLLGWLAFKRDRD